MAEFILFYHGGRQPETPEEGAAHMEKWQAWVADLGDALVNPQMPLGQRKTVSSESVTEGGATAPMLGFSILAASDMDAAVEIAKTCPFLAMGTIEVAQVMQMPT